MDGEWDIDCVVLLFADYRLDNVLPADIWQQRERVEEHAFFCWAVDELENYILSHYSDTDPIDACMAFIRQMSYYSRRYPKTRSACQIAMDVGYDIADILMCEKDLCYE